MGHLNNIVSTGLSAASESDLGFIKKAQKQEPGTKPDPARMQRWALHSEVNDMIRKNRIHGVMLNFVREGKHPFQEKIISGDHIGGFWQAFLGGAARRKHVIFARLLQDIK